MTRLFTTFRKRAVTAFGAAVIALVGVSAAAAAGPHKAPPPSEDIAAVMQYVESVPTSHGSVVASSSTYSRIASTAAPRRSRAVQPPSTAAHPAHRSATRTTTNAIGRPRTSISNAVHVGQPSLLASVTGTGNARVLGMLVALLGMASVAAVVILRRRA